MGSVWSGVPIALAESLCKALELEGAIETGTYLGESTRQLAEIFRQVQTIELSPTLYEQAKQQAPTNIAFHLGSSAEILGQVIANAAGPQLFWLDGHWSGDSTAGVDDECPVLEEIGAIDASAHGAESAVLIDDARLFLVPPPPPHKREQWPTFMEVADLLRLQHPRYVTVVEDVIVAVPPNARRLVEDYAMRKTADGRAVERRGLIDRLRRR